MKRYVIVQAEIKEGKKGYAAQEQIWARLRLQEFTDVEDLRACVTEKEVMSNYIYD